MSRISERALLRLVSDSTNDHSWLPLAVDSAMISPEANGATTTWPSTAGLDALSMRAVSSSPWKVQSAAPSAVEKVCSSSSTSTANTLPSATVGAPWMGAMVSRRHFTVPSLGFIAATKR